MARTRPGTPPSENGFEADSRRPRSPGPSPGPQPRPVRSGRAPGMFVYWRRIIFSTDQPVHLGSMMSRMMPAYGLLSAQMAGLLTVEGQVHRVPFLAQSHAPAERARTDDLRQQGVSWEQCQLSAVSGQFCQWSIVALCLLATPGHPSRAAGRGRPGSMTHSILIHA